MNFEKFPSTQKPIGFGLISFFFGITIGLLISAYVAGLTGIKVIYDKDKNVKINYIIPNSNADNINIKLNDTIVSINNTSLSGIKSIDIAKMIFNSDNKTLQMTIDRNGEKFSVTLKI